jgi:DNA (cytosine-5)-methyltransferase 1
MILEINKEIESRIKSLIKSLDEIVYQDNKINSEYLLKKTVPYIETCLQNKLQLHENNSKYDFIDLFAGAGGLSLGLENAGFNPVLVVDNYKAANKTYLFNRPFLSCDKIISEDIKTVGPNEFSRTPLVVGGPPCQGFSNANKQRKQGDDRNQLYKFFVKSVASVRPKIFLMENVEGIIPYKGIIKEDFLDIGYKARVFRVNTKDLGLPQHRKRVFFLGIDNDISSIHDELFSMFSFNEFAKNTYTLESAIADLPALEAKTLRNSTLIESENWGYTIGKIHVNKSHYSELLNGHKNFEFPLLNHRSKYNNDRDIEIYSLLKQGEKSDAQSIQHLNPYKSRDNIFKDKFYKMRWDEPSKTMTAHMYYDCHMYIHPTQARGLTPREAARIQGFPDDYLFLGSPNEWYRQIGNAVSPILASFMGNKLKQILDRIYSQ